MRRFHASEFPKAKTAPSNSVQSDTVSLCCSRSPPNVYQFVCTPTGHWSADLWYRIADAYIEAHSVWFIIFKAANFCLNEYIEFIAFPSKIKFEAFNEIKWTLSTHVKFTLQNRRHRPSFWLSKDHQSSSRSPEAFMSNFTCKLPSCLTIGFFLLIDFGMDLNCFHPTTCSESLGTPDCIPTAGCNSNLEFSWFDNDFHVLIRLSYTVQCTNVCCHFRNTCYALFPSHRPVRNAKSLRV